VLLPPSAAGNSLNNFGRKRAGLKTLLETGETLTTPGSLKYVQPAEALV
jgi:hypothetical protein